MNTKIFERYICFLEMELSITKLFSEDKKRVKIS